MTMVPLIPQPKATPFSLRIGGLVYRLVEWMIG